ncbi:acetaldehyde dehydrogenase [Lachnotalea glycerini]|uniref:Acetaldehyde dehydrogenase n=1 Tax=Lachnotalea glycerini TaxID=1763509 RepID=A0A255KV45_9FIRM|nr:acetaldehyde dehydrogenase (acetylating) [Lachnotalea glycerini]OYO67836.1 acetaldehyde dehydrogenase (acetylating) [Lachnotalea glycerini]PXV87260.1 acetaldehyde dehydrogenase [Lachnotalea glycerini]RDY31692.1 acetaldehyde dehydrogenase (acetylating) [Lachnotalea glycerini]
MNKIKVGIIGTGNIGTDILLKLKRSENLECGMFAGRNPDSEGIKLAKRLGINTSTKSIQAIIDNPDCCDIVFDATSASIHKEHAPILKELKKYTIDLTPARVGKMCVPVINMEECLSEDNVNLITCGGQATVPIAYAINQVHPDTKYIEIAASISSKSAGAGTRNNIDEFTQTTRDALQEFTSVEKSKAIIILNSANPPVNMRNTVYALIDHPNMDEIKKNVNEMVHKIQKYVPGYHLLYEPVFENGRVSTAIEVIGLGDYLPKYSGNLDIITCAAIEIAQAYAKKLIYQRRD